MRVPRTFTLEINLIETLKKESKITGVPQAEIVNRALNFYLNNKPQKEGK
jgi:hypothetical protein